jgi:hypothetical protein
VVGISYLSLLAAFARLTALALRDISRRRFLDNAAARALPPLLRNSASVRVICGHYTMHASSGSVALGITKRRRNMTEERTINEETKKRRLTVLEFAASAFAIVFVLGSYTAFGYLIYRYWRPLYEDVNELVNLHTRSYPKGVLFALVALIVGLALFKLRTAARIHYGLTEIMFGMLSVIATVSPFSENGSSIQILQVGAGIYIIVRGLDNLKIGLDAAPTHSMWGLWNIIFSKEDRSSWARRVLKSFVAETIPLPFPQVRPEDEDMPNDRAIDEFFKYGCQYYVAGRYGVFASLIPIAANLHHHAIEMLLKGALSKSMTLKEMKARLKHKLEKTWETFKAQANDTSLNRFDGVIEELNKFEDIRYPDNLLKNGASMTFGITKAGAAMTSTSGVSVPSYELCLEEIDELIAEIFKVASRNPNVYLKGMMRKDATDYVERDNRFFK